MEHKLAALREKIADAGLCALLVTSSANRRYLSGFTGSAGALLITAAELYLFADTRYQEQARNESPHFTVVALQTELWPEVADVCSEHHLKKIGFEAKAVTYFAYKDMVEAFSVTLVPIEDLIEDLRLIKNEAELKILRSGCSWLDRAYLKLLETARAGLTEAELSLELEFYLRQNGASAASFPYIVASGERGALPHGVASDKKLTAGEMVTVDFGAVFEGYATDMTRTFAIGDPAKKMRQIFAAVLQAQQEAADQIAPGMKGKEAHAIAMKIIEDAGYGPYFGHGLGHGVGLEVHEGPTLGPKSESLLKPGMVVTVEPGIYIPGLGGVRIEDMVVITADGAERLTISERELICL